MDSDLEELIASVREEGSGMKEKKRGVVYLSRIPPFMSPDQVATHFAVFGEIVRVYLTPEDNAVSRKRRKLNGDSRKRYKDGWVEFKKRKHAKLAASALNCQKVGGKKGNKYHDDMWNVKYLKGFKWTELTEQISYEKAVRDQKIRSEMSQAKREQKFYAKKVHEAKKHDAIQKRKKTTETESVRPVKRRFKQHEVKSDTNLVPLDQI